MCRGWLVWVVLAGSWAVSGAVSALADTTEYAGMCNASAAVALGNDLFVVADDEDSGPTPLRLYRIGQAGKPLAETTLSDGFLDLLDEKKTEVDIEGAAQIGDIVFWIGSHSASRKGKKRPSRRRLFATRLHFEGEGLAIEGVGNPYKHLIRDLHSDSRYARFKLKKAAKRPSKKSGALSIEGLASTPEGELLIGFRNPISAGKALVVRLKNPGKVIAGASAQFGDPIELDLGGLGIRSMERRGNEYFIVAGSYDGRGEFSLYQWGFPSERIPRPVPVVKMAGLNPEVIFFSGDSTVVLSDDGKQKIEGIHCQDLPRLQQRFRGVMLDLE